MDPSDLSRQVHLWKVSLIVCAVSCAGSTLLVIIRIYSRVTAAAGYRPRALGRNDMFIMIAWLLAATMSALNIYLSIKIRSDASAIDNHLVGEVNFATQICWVLSLWATTLSVLACYGRTFREFITTPRERLKLYIPAILISIWGIGSFIFVVAGEGKHVDRYWLSGPDKAYKIRIWATTIINGAVELIVLFVPVPWIFWERRTWILSLTYLLLFLTGVATIALSVLRFVYLQKRIGVYQKIKEEGFEDGNYGIIAVMLSVLEANVAIVCACLPILRYYSWYRWWSARYYTFTEWLWKDKDGDASGKELRTQTIGPPRSKDVESGHSRRPSYSPQLNDVHHSPGELEADPIQSPASPFIPRLPGAERHEPIQLPALPFIPRLPGAERRGSEDIEMNDLQDYVPYVNRMLYRDV